MVKSDFLAFLIFRKGPDGLALLDFFAADNAMALYGLGCPPDIASFVPGFFDEFLPLFLDPCISVIAGAFDSLDSIHHANSPFSVLERLENSNQILTSL